MSRCSSRTNAKPLEPVATKQQEAVPARSARPTSRWPRSSGPWPESCSNSLGARLIPAAEAALITQLENVLGPLWVWLAGIERPPAATIVGGVIVICAVVFQVTQT